MSIAKYLGPVSWTLWGALLLLLVWGFVKVLTERSNSPEGGRGIAVVVLGFLVVVLAGVGLWLYGATRRGASGSLVTLTLLMAFPLVLLIASPIVKAWKTWRFESELKQVGDFPDPSCRALAEKIQTGDTAGLQRQLAGAPPPGGRDRAGNDLLAFAVLVVRDRKGNPELVRVLLEAGADPGKSGTPDGGSLLGFMTVDRSPVSTEVVRLLLQHGADPNVKDAQSGMTAMADAGDRPELVRLLLDAGASVDERLPGGESMLVRFVGMRQWDSALYLIEKGANLDVTNPNGLSLDYYLKDWKDSVYGDHPEGWEKVREAILARRR